MNPDGSGIVIFRVPPSRAAPHRSIDKECYVRRGANSVPIGMREIQDMTLARGQRDRRVEERFATSTDKFARRFVRQNDGDQPRVGFRITAVSIGAEFNLRTSL